jgi:hypothetical protein
VSDSTLCCVNGKQLGDRIFIDRPSRPFFAVETIDILWLCQNSYGKWPFLMGKSTISMAIFNSYVKLPEGIQPRKMVI